MKLVSGTAGFEALQSGSRAQHLSHCAIQSSVALQEVLGCVMVGAQTPHSFSSRLVPLCFHSHSGGAFAPLDLGSPPGWLAGEMGTPQLSTLKVLCAYTQCHMAHWWGLGVYLVSPIK